MTPPKENDIFVFGSNLSGFHGAGAAHYAFRFLDAEYGNGITPTKQTYPIPTKDRQIVTMKLADIKPYIDKFIQYVKDNPDKNFFITRIGCGLAGYKDFDIAPLFSELFGYANCSFPKEWERYEHILPL